MAVKRTRARFPDKPTTAAPCRWLSIDPASGSKPTVVAIWEGALPLAFADVRHEDHKAIEALLAGVDLVVLEGGGFVGINPASALALERVRGRFEAWATAKRIPYVEVRPDGWRGVMGLPARPRKRAAVAWRSLVRAMAKDHELAGKATNDDKRAALLIGWACVMAWRWN